MCGIFGIVSETVADQAHLDLLVRHAQQRGRDSSGLMFLSDAGYEVHRADDNIEVLRKSVGRLNSKVVMGHSRLVTNGLADNQPVLRNGICVFHNGIIVNDDEIWPRIGACRELVVDTEVIAAIAEQVLEAGGGVGDIPARVFEFADGIVACALAIPRIGKLCLFSNNGSLYLGHVNGATLYASESHALTQIGCEDVRQVFDPVVLDIPVSARDVTVTESKSRVENLIPPLTRSSAEEELLVFPKPDLKRCTRCILPETMPFIAFDDEGVCNYCRHYRKRNVPRPVEELFDLVEPYRRAHGNDCIIPFSGGRDSCYGLHLVVKELKMKPITYTYEWGMVNDLGRRNISRMCARLGVENIIVADDISKKRRNIALNLKAWLKSPHLGMVSILTAGDKHFFRHVETIKQQTGINLNLWGINPLEVTHFKAGFLGVPPDFAEERVYSHGAMKQLRYQMLRLKAMVRSPGYFNRSLWDTISGEYYRSSTKKSDYFHIFDYWRWDEKLVEDTLDDYEWERAPDTRATWRIGDGTAAFYNYIYYTVAGFSEHDTFRSNQIREGDLDRETALRLVAEENTPRYPNIKWYLDAIGFDFADTIKVVNNIPRLHGA